MATFRKSITLPLYLENYVESTENFSAIVTELLDENITRLEDNSLAYSRKEKKRQAKDVLLSTIDNASKSIAKDVAIKELEILQHLVDELREDRINLELMSTRMRYIEGELDKVKSSKERDIKIIVYKAIKESVEVLFRKNVNNDEDN